MFEIKERYDYGTIVVVNQNKSIEVTLKWNECVDYFKSRHNEPVNHAKGIEMDYLHICQLDEFLNLLKELETLQKENPDGTIYKNDDENVMAIMNKDGSVVYKQSYNGNTVEEEDVDTSHISNLNETIQEFAEIYNIQLIESFCFSFENIKP